MPLHSHRVMSRLFILPLPKVAPHLRPHPDLFIIDLARMLSKSCGMNARAASFLLPVGGETNLGKQVRGAMVGGKGIAVGGRQAWFTSASTSI